MAQIEKGNYNMLEIMENLPATELDAFKWTSVMCKKIASKDALRPSFCGVYYNNGFAFCTDAYQIVVYRYSKIDNAFEGKIVTTNKKLGLPYNKSVDGSIIDGGYPNCKSVIGNTHYKFSLSLKEIKALRQLVENYYEKSKEENPNKRVGFSYKGVFYNMKIPFVLNLLDILIKRKKENADFYFSDDSVRPYYAVCGSMEILLMPMVANEEEYAFDLESVLDKLSTTEMESKPEKATPKENPIISFLKKHKDAGGFLFAKDEKEFFVSDKYYLIELSNNENNKEILDFVETNFTMPITFEQCQNIMNKVKDLKPFDIDDFLKKCNAFYENKVEEAKRVVLEQFNRQLKEQDWLLKDVEKSGIDTNNYEDVKKFIETTPKSYSKEYPKPKYGEVWDIETKEFADGQVCLKDEKWETTFFATDRNRYHTGIETIVKLFKQLGYDEILCGVGDKKVLFSTKNGDLKFILMGAIFNNNKPSSQFPYTIKGDVVTQENISNEKELFAMLTKALEKNSISVSFADETETWQQLKREGSNDEDIEFSITETSESDDLEEDIAESYQTSMPFDYNEETNELKQKIVSLEAENEKLKMLAQKVCELKETYGLSTISADDRKELLKMLKNC
jgi:hypothetical protein